jgi:hypothetical protein
MAPVHPARLGRPIPRVAPGLAFIFVGSYRERRFVERPRALEVRAFEALRFA